jgi:hypothetical protein
VIEQHPLPETYIERSGTPGSAGYNAEKLRDARTKTDLYPASRLDMRHELYLTVAVLDVIIALKRIGLLLIGT